MLESQTGNADPDAPIRATDNDAAIARLSAVQKGYLIDHYIAPLVPRAHLHQPRSPLINIGTYLRARGIDDLLENWFRLTGERKVQIVNLGAGSDTRFWRLAVRICFFYIRKQEKKERIDIVSQNGPRAGQLHRYIEIDFAENTSRKAMSIRKSRVLSAALGNPDAISVGRLSFFAFLRNRLIWYLQVEEGPRYVRQYTISFLWISERPRSLHWRRFWDPVMNHCSLPHILLCFSSSAFSRT